MYFFAIAIALAVGGFILGRAFSPDAPHQNENRTADNGAFSKITALKQSHGLPLSGTDLQIANALSDQLATGDAATVFNSAWTALESLPPIRQRELKSIILRWWARLDPQSALSTIAPAADGLYNSTLIGEWSLTDPITAFEAAAQLHPSYYPKTIAITTMARTDRNAALEKCRAANMRFPNEAVAEWAEESFEEALDFRLRHPEYFDPTNSIPRLAKQLNGSPDKMQMALRQLANTPIPPDLHHSEKRAKSELLRHAERYASAELLESETDRDSFAYIFNDWISHAPEEALAWLDSQPHYTEFRITAVEATLENIPVTHDQIPRIQSYLNELPTADQSALILNDLLSPLPGKDLQSDLAWIDAFKSRIDESEYFTLVHDAICGQTFPTQQEHLAAIRATNTRFEEARNYLAHRFIAEHPAEAAQLLASQELPTNRREFHLQTALERWAVLDPQPMLEFARVELHPAEAISVLKEVLTTNDFPASTERLIDQAIEEISVQ